MSFVNLTDVTYKYSQSNEKAIDGLNLQIDKGEYVAVAGFNGSGKSTLARLIAGFINPDEGKIELEKGVLPGIVFQQPKEQIVAGVVERDTAFGPQNLNMSKAEVELRTIECLSVVGIADKALNRTFELSLGQTQRLAFSGILALFPDLLILDEVTAMLDPDVREELVEFIRQWNLKGHTIIHITHDEDEVLAAQRVVILDHGKKVFDGSTDEFKNSGELRSALFNMDALKKIKSSSTLKTEEKETSLSVENLSFSYEGYDVFKNISFELKKGSLVAFTGPSGCGKSTLFECLAGLKKPVSGTIRALCKPALALQESEAALFERYAADDVAFGPSNSGVEGKALLKRVKHSMEMSGLPYKEYADRSSFNLSGGEKRKLSIAGIIALDRDILIFDEPTSALDAVSRVNILQTLRNLADEGKTVIFSTHRMEEAVVADQHILWTELTCNTETKQVNPVKTSGLQIQEPSENMFLLNSISKLSGEIMAPSKVPHSVLSGMPAWIKTFIFLSLFTVSLSVQSVFACAVMICVNFLYVILNNYSLKKIAGAFRKILPIIIFFLILEFIFYPSKTGEAVIFKWKFFIITKYKIVIGVKMILHAICAIAAISTYISSTSEREVMDGLAGILKPFALIHIPVRYFVLVVGIIFRFMPLLLDELSAIIKTQIVRGTFANAKGIKKIKILIPLFVPLMLQTFRKAQFLADALTARYFK